VPQEFSTNLINAWRKGLAETGFVEGRNVAIESLFVASIGNRRRPFLGVKRTSRYLRLLLAASSDKTR